jgi:hypothetical protein
MRVYGKDILTVEYMKHGGIYAVFGTLPQMLWCRELGACSKPILNLPIPSTGIQIPYVAMDVI